MNDMNPSTPQGMLLFNQYGMGMAMPHIPYYGAFPMLSGLPPYGAAANASHVLPAKPSKRSLTKRACVHCKAAKAACDSGRPCKRCMTVGKATSCVDSKHNKRGRKPKPRAEVSFPTDDVLKTESGEPLKRSSDLISTSAAFEARHAELDSLSVMLSMMYGYTIHANTRSEAVQLSQLMPAFVWLRHYCERLLLSLRKYADEHSLTLRSSAESVTQIVHTTASSSYSLDRLLQTLSVPKVPLRDRVELATYEDFPLGVFALPLFPRPFSRPDLVSVNSAFCSITGFSNSELVRMLASREGLNTIIEPSSYLQLQSQLLTAIMQRVTSQTFTATLLHRSRRAIPVMISQKLNYTEEGFPQSLLCFVQVVAPPQTVPADTPSDAVSMSLSNDSTTETLNFDLNQPMDMALDADNSTSSAFDFASSSSMQVLDIPVMDSIASQLIAPLASELHRASLSPTDTNACSLLDSNGLPVCLPPISALTSEMVSDLQRVWQHLTRGDYEAFRNDTQLSPPSDRDLIAPPAQFFMRKVCERFFYILPQVEHVYSQHIPELGSALWRMLELAVHRLTSSSSGDADVFAHTIYQLARSYGLLKAERFHFAVLGKALSDCASTLLGHRVSLITNTSLLFTYGVILKALIPFVQTDEALWRAAFSMTTDFSDNTSLPPFCRFNGGPDFAASQ